MKRRVTRQALVASLAAVVLYALADDPPELRYRKAIEDARAGRVAEALGVLRPLVAQFPARQDMLGDTAVVLGWGGEHAAALALLPQIDRANAPAHVLEGLAESARATQDLDLAEALYRESIARFPGRADPWLGLGGIASARGDNFRALAIYESVLASFPGHERAVQGRKVQVLSLLGAPKLALELADRHPGVATPAQREMLEADQTAHKIRWGTIAADSGRGPGRFAGLDAALADSDAAAARALDPANELNPAERQLVLDRISALRERHRTRDAVALYEAMAARPGGVPHYVKTAAASAYLHQRQPGRARDLYREALAVQPANVESQMGLFYALSDAEQHAEALEHIQHVVSITPPHIDAWSAATMRDNPAYVRVLGGRAIAPLFANRPGEGWQRLRQLSDAVPADTGIRTDLGSSMRARGWPRKAEQELRLTLAVDLDNAGALGERAGALREMRDYRNAESALALAQSVSAEDGRVIRAGRLWTVHNMHELVVDVAGGRSSGGPTGTRDQLFDAWLYSKPLDYNYRFFTHVHSARADYAGGTGRRERAGIGLEYRSTLFSATGELSKGLANDRNGAAASLAYTPDDHWTFRGSLDSSSNDTPLQARLAGIDGRRASVEASWQAHESRGAAVSHAFMRFSDGNRRESTLARWTERIISGPVYKLEVTGSLYASRNSLAGAPYFNPSRDFGPTLEFANEWVQWRRYERAFRHRLYVALGNYRQQGFATGPTSNLRYEQEWAADDQLTLRYGIGRSQHPYDGVRDTRNYGYLSLNWRF